MKFLQGLLKKLAKWLGLSIQGEGERTEGKHSDYSEKLNGLSVVDIVSLSIVPLTTEYFQWRITGESKKAEYLKNLAESFVNNTLVKSVETCLNTGDVLAVPIQSHGKIITQLVDNNSYTIIDSAGDELYEIQFVIDTYKGNNSTQYVLLEDITYDPQTKANIYSLYVAVNGTISTNLSQVKKWADYDQQWIIPNVDKMLIGRMKCPTVDPANINNVKGIPLCAGAGTAIESIKELYKQEMNEFIAAEKMIFADKSLFVNRVETDENGEIISKTPVLPKGKQRVFQAVNVGGMDNEGLIQEYSPDIRSEQYSSGIDQMLKLLEKSIGVSNGALSEADATYQNVDNVRKANQKTNSIILSIRRAADTMLSDLLYAWSMLCNYYLLVPMGDFDEIHDWSDEWITSAEFKQQQLLAGVNIGAISVAEYRQWVTEDSLEDAEKAVAKIAADRDFTYDLLADTKQEEQNEQGNKQPQEDENKDEEFTN